MLRWVLPFSLFVVTAAACSTANPADPTSANANAVMTPTVVPTFATDIEPLLQDKCQRCHHDGGIAPFSLVTYDEAKQRAPDARVMVTSRSMPPWGAFDQDTCKMQRPIKDDLRLTDAQVNMFAAWVDAGSPMGDESKRPPPKTDFGPTGLDGVTDTFQLAAPYKVEPGTDDIECFPIDPKLTEDTYVTGTNVVPGEPGVVHHVIVYVDPKQEGPAKAAPNGHYPCFGSAGVDEQSVLLAWAPGVPPTGFGNTDAGIKIPKGAGLVMQVHYHPSNDPKVDQSSFQLRRMPSGQKPNHIAQVILAGNAKDAQGSNTKGLIKLLPGPDDPPSGPAFFIPSGATAHTESMDVTVPPQLALLPAGSVHVALMGSHMHWAGVDQAVTITRANPNPQNPANECLLSAPKYDFNWQRGYTYDQSFDDLPTISSGDKINITCTYNNSPSNKNIQKQMTVERLTQPYDLTLGESTQNEMCLAVLVIVRPPTALD
jgi:hypothetical protein